MMSMKRKNGQFMALGALEEKFWTNFCLAVERPDLVKEQFAVGSRLDESSTGGGGYIQEKDQDEWEAFFANVDACCTPVLELHECAQNEHIQARKMLFELEHPVEGRIKQLGFPIKFSDSSLKSDPCHPCGESTRRRSCLHWGTRKKS